MARLSGCDAADVLAEGIRLPRPLSPHRSAELAGCDIDVDAVAATVTARPGGRPWIVEGAGGVLVPLNHRELMVDLMARLGLPAVLVTRSRLGTINHTLLTIEALGRRAIPVAGVVMVGDLNPDNRTAIERYGRVRVVGELPTLGHARARVASALGALRPRRRRAARGASAMTHPLGGPPLAPTLAERDRAHLWHPYTQMLTAPSPLPIVRGEGVYLYTDDGRRLLDGISSWWVNIHGHSHPKINAALAEQASRLEHVVFAGCTHPPAVELAERLVAILPPGLTRVFYSDNGSTTVEVALKLVRHYWINRGQRSSSDLHRAASRVSR